MLSLAVFVAVLSVLVLVHEWGHFIASRMIGVRVEKFSLGFGPKIWSKKAGETEYLISGIPLGGYVKLAGDEPTREGKYGKDEYLSRPVGDRVKILFAGPFVNYLLAFLLFSFIYMVGSPTATTVVGGLLPEFPAKAAGLAVGDEIIAVDGKDVRYWEELTKAIRAKVEGDLVLGVKRDGRGFTVRIAPKVKAQKDIFGNEVRIALIGVMPSERIENVRYGFFESFGMGLKKLLDLTAATYKAIWSLMTGRLSFRDSMTGPLGILIITGRAAHLGLIYVLHLMAALSASLAIFNLLPIPVLDGGHLVFLGLEKLMKRPLSQRAQEAITNVGIALLTALMVYVLYADIVRFQIIERVLKLFRG